MDAKPTTSQTVSTQFLGRALRLPKTVTIGDVEYPLCRNAYAGESAWFCYHYAGRITSGKESLNEHNRCEACAIAVPPYAEEPSFMQTNEE